MSNAAASEPTEPVTGPTAPLPSARQILESIDARQRDQGLPELSDEEAMALAVRETRAVRQELSERGLL